MDEQIKSMLEQAQIIPGGGSKSCTLQLAFNVPGHEKYHDHIIFDKDQKVEDVIHKLRCLANRLQHHCVENTGARMRMQSGAQTSLKYRQKRIN